ncbi:aldo/keto reductase [Leuconostoc falkenbergense]|uniref:aldo/keto reductase n=1 Tax=Leuconostoc falkenbergense TaxID=2766470 RepID=UPI0024AD03CF|nr:aldo/keto reductase [Leuconostoc falkenbergense]MDI6666710.1 aldo/keto reductase [Leuconostoc falkenbergense]
MISEVTLNNGIKMPLIGFGVFQVSDLEQTKESVLLALKNGYRLIDTASSYGNEEAVGQAIIESNVPRQDIFVTTKAFVNQMGYNETIQAFYESLNKLGLDYLDLYLIHMPFGDYYGSYRALIDLYHAGKIRAIGISNFDEARLTDLVLNFNVVPQVNQIEHHPHFQRTKLLDIMAGYNIQPEAWAPFAEGMNGMFDEDILVNIAKNHKKSVPQVIIRWNIQQDIVVIPKSVHENRIQQNIAVQDFELSSEEMAAIKNLDMDKPDMLDINDSKEVRRVYDYLNNPVLTTLNDNN